LFRHNRPVRAVIVLALAAASCGRLGFDAPSDPFDREVDAGVQSDADPLGIARCGTPGAIADRFDVGVSPTWQLFGPDWLAVVDGEIRISLPTGAAARSGVRSWATTDVRDARAGIEVTEVVDPASVVEAYFALVHDATNQVAIALSHGYLHFYRVEDGVNTPGEAVYDPDQHRFWQIREQAGTLFYEASADGEAFATLATAPTPAFADSVRIEVGAVAYAPMTSTGTFAVTAVNARVERADWCPIEALSDEFDAATIGRQWALRGSTTPSCAPAQLDGRARFDQDGAAATDCFYRSGPAYDLTAGELRIFLDAINTFHPDWSTYLSVVDAAGNTVELAFRQDLMCAELRGADGTPFPAAQGCMPYRAELEYWRIVERLGEVALELSADGVAWESALAIASPIALDAVQVKLGTRCVSALPFPIQLGFDRINVP
jgi:hypothetical protein